jgi:predicted nucleic acid-binding protein
VIYLDSSVALAHLLAEDRAPPLALWQETLVSSRLLVYETWVRVQARRLATSHGEALNELLARLSFLELRPEVLARALEPFPVAVRTLDALHLASFVFLRGLGHDLELASYDERQRKAAAALGLPLCTWV